MKVLLYGHTGWIGSQLKQILSVKNELICGNARLDDYTTLISEIISIKPTHVLNCAGLTGRPNIDWCEDHKIEVLQINVIAAAIISDICYRNNIHYTYIGTGCIYKYDNEHFEKGYTESDKPNFDGSFYSFSKIMTENITKNFPRTLTLRVRMPISDDLHHRNFITKITKYTKVVNIPNSMSILYDLLPIIPDMMEKEKTGVYNFTNPGIISHNDILKLYKEYIDPSFNWINFTEEEQSLVIKSPRSNNYLDATKLLNEYPNIPNIKESIINVFERMKSNLYHSDNC